MDYALLARQAQALVADEPDPLANLANFAALAFAEIPGINWAGFYFAHPDGALVLGPFGGKPACTRLPSGRGVCGAAAVSGTTVIVDDVDAFGDHIVCDSASQSEIVVPILRDGTTIAVFDIDAPRKSRFTEEDRIGIERLVATIASSAIQLAEALSTPSESINAVTSSNGSGIDR